MKTIIISDVHGRDMWKYIINQEQPDRVVFLGDYFDSFDIPGIDQIHNFKQIIEYKNSHQSEVILLIGNHDYHYFPEIGFTGTSGYQAKIAININYIINEIKLSNVFLIFLSANRTASAIIPEKPFF
jgi:predicted phosphodiesterase